MSASDPVEILAISTTYVDGIGTVDLMPSGNARMTFVEDQRSDGKVYRHVVARFVIPHNALVKAALTILREAERGHLPTIPQDGSDARH